jgi:hypothetical protein
MSIPQHNINMGNTLQVPDGPVYETMDQNQIKDNLHLTRRDKKKNIKILMRRVQDVTDQLLEEKAKVEGHKKQNKELAIMISFLREKESKQSQQSENIQIIKYLFSLLINYQSICSSIELARKETLV